MSKLLLVPIYFFTFMTGAAGLIYEVTWQKYLSRMLGSDSIATAVILATFLGGLSAGYYLCGKLTTKVKNHFLRPMLSSKGSSPSGGFSSQ